jgi:transposase
MINKRKSYDEDFKRKAVEHLEQTRKSLAQLARELDVPANNLTVWRKKYGSHPNKAVEAKPFVDYEQLKKLEQQNRDLREEVEILKKAMHFFTKNRD